MRKIAMNGAVNKGRTATHEIGHWLNLMHIWGDNSGCSNTQRISDFVLDTPPSSSSNFGCPSGIKRCAANPYSQDMYMNFMDYVDDSCMVMFTQLQNARAQASIQQYRGGFQVLSLLCRCQMCSHFKSKKLLLLNNVRMWQRPRRST